MNNNPYPIQIKKSIQLNLFSTSLIIIIISSGLFILLWLVHSTLEKAQLLLIILIIGVIIFFCCLIIILSVIYDYFYLSSLKYSIEGKNFFFSGGILGKFEKNLPYSKIQHVIIYETFMQRLFRLSSISIETAREAGYNPYENVKQYLPITTGPLIPNLNKEEAKKLRDRIISASSKHKPLAGI
ncbi:PH domain-containing protein [Candidatus Woesearchaeota archaeon]|nr:PH domain-containing protein [Candidatus Woesearchaeota archaeon]